MSTELAKAYEPGEVEKRVYDFWMRGNYFHAEVDPKKKPYAIVMPPPNITGQLHVGHAMDGTLPDVLIRWRRMQGYSALWLPGTDHASIATEAKIVAAMREEGLTKEDIGREKFLERAWAWRDKYGSRIVEQQKLLGLSCDWARQRFTMDEGCSRAVRRVFVNLYRKGLIYQGNRMVNWCPHCETSISDIEVVYEERNGHFWHLLYPVKETGELLELATTRPETMLGDTAVAINPEDPRYKHLHGCHVILPLLEKEIPIVLDEHADMEKGTGVVKITPAHDPNDFEVGLRHNLPIVRCFTYDGYMTGPAERAAYEAMAAKGRLPEHEPEVLDCGKYAGMTTAQAREAILEDLTARGALKSVEPLTHEVGTCYRCGNTIEPMVSNQWFVKMEPLAGPAVECVKDGRIRFIPKERATKTYYNWMENIKDWCISRQLWWGHRIPAWTCEDCGEMTVSETDLTACPHCGGTRLKQDEDTLDTWFSSALWPFSTLGWPEKTPELDYFYPTDVLMPGFDIIFFWVARMIFSGMEHMGDVPFRTVFFHGLIRDALGRKMSKSLDNGVDPVEVIERYGADALRYMLVSASNTAGNDMRFSDEKVAAARNFANKIWNAARFIHMNIDGREVPAILPETLTMEDKWIVSGYNRLVAEITENLEKFELGVAAGKVYDFLWGDFCDWFIELAKIRMNGPDEADAQAARQVLVWVLGGTLKLLHPFMPFITEEIWQSLPHEGEALIVAPWPVYDPALDFPAEEREVRKVMELITAVRTRRSEMGVPPSRKASLFVETADPAPFEAEREAISRLCSCGGLEIGGAVAVEGAVTVVTSACKGYLPLEELVDKAAETARLTKELEGARKQLATAEAKLNNPAFTGKAPQNVVDGVRDNAEKLREKVRMIQESLKAFE